MYAFAFYNRRERELILARDPFGEKPLYYTFNKDYFAFASELEALAQIPDFKREIDPVAIEQYLLLQYVPAPKTIYKDVFKLSPGTSLKLSKTRQTSQLKSIINLNQRLHKNFA
jgi:Asparagine synthase (glutamine-hydrolyzing)